jgi:hypothetical protein
MASTLERKPGPETELWVAPASRRVVCVSEGGVTLPFRVVHDAIDPLKHIKRPKALLEQASYTDSD